MTRNKKLSAIAVAAAAVLAVSAALAGRDPEVAQEGWAIDSENPQDVFTFVRLRYSSSGRRRWGGGGGWQTDYPDSDKNFSYRLQQLTSWEVTPEHVVLDITDAELFDYPWAYMVEPGRLQFSEDEVLTLRRWLLAGGFLVVDDFWGDAQLLNFETEIRRVLPDRPIQSLDMSHPIFHAVFDLKEPPQVPSLHDWMSTGLSYEVHGSSDTRPHFRALFDDKGRMLVMICHNTDLGDGWEREGENHEYFKTFAEPRSYPMGINILLYAMTH